MDGTCLLCCHYLHSGVPQLQSAAKATSTKERVRNRPSVKFGIIWKVVWCQRRFWLQRIWPSAMRKSSAVYEGFFWGNAANRRESGGVRSCNRLVTRPLDSAARSKGRVGATTRRGGRWKVGDTRGHDTAR
uniref:Uncharacterized protein n=1 Tax=Aegilops tauschii TaxID=37682 RepID=M8CDT4_AEGTA